MIKVETIRDIDDSTKEGKMLMSALAVLTSITHEQINDNEYGGNTHPDEVTERIADLTNRIYYEFEYKQLQEINKRDNAINQICQ
jgi:hypothetical protein